MARPIHFEIPADDPARPIAFYAEALGRKARKFDGMEYWFVRTGADAAVWQDPQAADALKAGGISRRGCPGSGCGDRS